MHRFWFDSSIQNNKAHLKGDLFHHICRVCRFDVKDRFILVASKGLQYTVEISEKQKDRALAKVIEVKQSTSRQKPYIHLCLSCPRFSVLEPLLKKMVELDISDLHLFTSDFSFIKKLNSIPETRFQRWKSIIQHSMAQSLRSRGFKVHPLEKLSSLLFVYSKAPTSKALFFYEGEGQQSIYQALSGLDKNISDVWLFLGGEGGFSPKEVQEFTQHSIPPTSIGSPILKVETACMAAVSLVKYQCKLF